MNLKSSMRRDSFALFALLLVSLLGAHSAAAIDKGDFVLGGGANFGVGLLFSGGVSTLVSDEWDYVNNAAGFEDPAKPILLHLTATEQAKFFVRMKDKLQGELWLEHLGGTPIGITTDYYDGYYGTSYSQKWTYTPAYWAEGVNVVLLPMGSSGGFGLKLGGGLGLYQATLHYRFESDFYQLVEDIHHEYEGSAVGFNLIGGISSDLMNIIEIDADINLRYAHIKELEGPGGVLRNPFKGNEVVSMDLTGFEFRVGAKIALDILK